MATVEEKLLVQIFDRKRNIVEQLKNQEQLFDKHLLSKLLIQGISPPPWLLNAKIHSSTSDLTVLNKEELISGLLLSRPGPSASYPSGPLFPYDKQAITAAYSGILDETCDVKSASSNGIDKDGPVVARLCHVDGTDDTAAIVPPSHLNGSMATSNYVPMSPEDQIDKRLSNAYKPEHSLARMHRSKSRQKALELRNSAKASAKSCLGMENDVGISSGRKIFRYDELCSKEEIDKGRNIGVCGGSLSCSTVIEAKEVDMGEKPNIEESRKFFGEKITSTSSCQQLTDGACLLDVKSKEVYVGRMTRSRSGKTQQAEADHLQNPSCTNYDNQSINTDHVIVNSKAYSGRITRSRSGGAKEVETRNERSRSRRDGFVEPKQLDFDEVEESNLGNNPNHVSETIRQGTLEERSIAQTIENTTFPCAFSTERTPVSYPESLACGNLEAPDSEVAHALPRSVRTSGHALILPDCLGGVHVSLDVEAVKVVQLSPGSFVPVTDFAPIVSGNAVESAQSADMMKLRSPSKSAAMQASSSSSHGKEVGCSKLPELGVAPIVSRNEVISAQSMEMMKLQSPSKSAAVQGSLSSSYRKEYGGSKLPEHGVAPVVSRDEVESAQSVEIMKLGSPSNCLAIQTSSSSSFGKEVGGSKPPELGIDLNMLSVFNSSVAMNGSLPCYKRRKIEYQNLNKSASPTLRVNSVHAINNNVTIGSAGAKMENMSMMSQNLTNSHNSHAILSSCSREIDQSVNSSLNKEHSLTPHVQCVKDKVSLEKIVTTSIREPQNLFEPDGSNVNQSVIAEPSDSLPEDVNMETDAPSAIVFNGRVSDGLVNGQNLVADNIGVRLMNSEPRHLSELDVLNASQCIIAEPSDSLPEDVQVETNAPSAVVFSGRLSNGLVNGQNLVADYTGVKSIDSEVSVDQRKSSQRLAESKLSISSPLMEYMNLVEADQTIPEYESFVVGENTVGAQNSRDKHGYKEIPFLSNIMDRTSLPENICKSATLSTPLSPFPTASKFYLAPGVYSSVPNGLLENIDIQSSLLPRGSALLGKSHSDLFSFPGSQFGWDLRKPFLSPVEKGFEGITSKSGGSDKLGSSNLELTCFPILEDPESSEEDVNDPVNIDMGRTDSTVISSVDREPLCDVTVQDESFIALEYAVEGGCLESVSIDVKKTDLILKSSGNKKSLCDITMQDDGSLALDHAVDQCSLGSVSTEFSVHETHNDSKMSGMGQRRGRHARAGKENNSFSVGTNSIKKHLKASSSRFSKPKLSEKSNLRSSGQSLSEKGQKCNNIVSNVRSFVSLVQQKQAAAVVPEKKDVKVKALQAAEAAKRAAEKRDNERKQKKEAMKLERARVEQEYLKEMELKKKLKEEEKKKREAENAAKKRQRENEERKEKERKKRRIEEARQQHKQAEEKLHAFREESRYAAQDERGHQRKDSCEKIENQVDRGDEGDDSSLPLNDTAVIGNGRREVDGLPVSIDHKMSMESSAIGMVGIVDMAESSTPNIDKNYKPNSRNSGQQSYDISPYQCSDDEEEEEDEIPKKFVPAWASKSCVALALSSTEHLNPDDIFPPGSFCSLEEVLLPRRLPQK